MDSISTSGRIDSGSRQSITRLPMVLTRGQGASVNNTFHRRHIAGRASCAALVLLGALAGSGVFTPTPAMAQTTATSTPQVKLYKVSPGTLESTLTDFAGAAGVSIAIPPELVQGRQSAGLSGTYSIGDGFNVLLQDSGLEAVTRGDNAYAIRRAPAASGRVDGGQLPAVEVQASAERDVTSEGTGSYAARGASIMKGAQSLKEIPQSVSVITNQRMEDQNLTSLQQVLEQATGIYVNSFRSVYGGNGNSASYFSRGFDIQNYMVDGVSSKSSDPYSGTNNALEGGSAIYDRIEVLRGAAGLLIGNGGPGGTINLVRKRPTREFQQNYTLSAGSWNNHRGEADIAGPLNDAGTLRGRTVLSYQDNGRFWESTHSSSPLLYGILEADLAASTKLSLGARYEKYRETAVKQVYFRSTAASFIPSRSALYSPTWGYSNSEDKEVFLDLNHELSRRWKISLALSHKEKNFEGVLPYVYPTGGSLQVRSYEEATDSLDANVLGAFDAFGREHKLVFGFNASRQDQKSRISWNGNLASWSDIATVDMSTAWPYDARMQNLVASTFASSPENSKTESYGLFGKLNVSLSQNLTAILGARASWYKYRVYDSDGSYQPYSSGQITGEITPYAGLVYQLNPQWSVYASYADIFNPQLGYYTRSGKTIDNEIGKNVEFGIKGELFGGRVNTAFAIYQVDLNNTAQLDLLYEQGCPGNPTGGSCYYSIGHKRTRGFDAEVNGELMRGWQVGAGYTYTQSKILSADSGEGYASSSTPKHMVKLFSSYQPDDNWTIGGGAQIQSKESLTSEGITASQSGYAIWNTFARYRINKNLTASLNINNLFDKTYWANGSALFKSRYGDPRNFMLTLRVKY